MAEIIPDAAATAEILAQYKRMAETSGRILDAAGELGLDAETVKRLQDAANRHKEMVAGIEAGTVVASRG